MIATTGMRSFRASAIAMCSLRVSTTYIAAGRVRIAAIPLRYFSRRASSSIRCDCSRLGRISSVPLSRMSTSSLRRSIRLLIVLKLVSMPPSQR